MPVPSLITDLSQTAASNYPQGSDSPSNLDDTQRAHGAFIAMLRDGKGFANPATLASAATVDIGGQNSLSVEITGTTTITSFGITYNGPRFLLFTGALVLTHNATTLNLPGSANITTAAGDTAIALPNSALNGWNVVAFQRSSGLPTHPVDLQKQTYTSATTTGTAPTYVAAMSPAITALVAGKTRANLTFNVSNGGVASTLNVDGTGVIGLKQYDSTGAKVDPNIVASMNSDVVYDGAHWVVVDSLPVYIVQSAVRGQLDNLSIAAPGLNSYNVVITADEAVLEDSSNRYITVRAVSKTINANGVVGAPLSIMSARAASTWYYRWLWYNAALGLTATLDTSSTAPTAPTGYSASDYKARLPGASRTDASGSTYLLQIQTANRFSFYVPLTGSNVAALPSMASGVAGNVNVPTWSAVAVASFVPTTAKVIHGLANTGTGVTGQMILAPNASYGGYQSTTSPPHISFTSNSSWQANFRWFMALEGANIQYACSVAGIGIFCYGWED